MVKLQRLRPPGRNGGRPVHRDFWFVQPDGIKFPSESIEMRTGREPDSPNHQKSWAWALAHMQAEDLWLVIPIKQGEDQQRDLNNARASVWRTARSRKGLEIVSQYVSPNLYFAVVTK